MKRRIQVYHNGKPLCGSDYSMAIPEKLTTRQLKNRIELMKSRIKSLSANVATYLQTGTIEYRVER